MLRRWGNHRTWWTFLLKLRGHRGARRKSQRLACSCHSFACSLFIRQILHNKRIASYSSIQMTLNRIFLTSSYFLIQPVTW